MGWTANDMPSQAGKTAIVTGSNSGLGYETALALAAAAPPGPRPSPGNRHYLYMPSRRLMRCSTHIFSADSICDQPMQLP